MVEILIDISSPEELAMVVAAIQSTGCPIRGLGTPTKTAQAETIAH